MLTLLPSGLVEGNSKALMDICGAPILPYPFQVSQGLGPDLNPPQRSTSFELAAASALIIKLQHVRTHAAPSGYGQARPGVVSGCAVYLFSWPVEWQRLEEGGSFLFFQSRSPRTALLQAAGEQSGHSRK